MGAWGPGIFDDDAAYDFVEIIRDADEPTEVFQTSFETALQAEYLEYDDAHAVTVSAAYMDAFLNGTSYESEDKGAIASFTKRHKSLPLTQLKAAAVQALQKVLGKSSELNELWKENEDLYPQWKQNINALIERLR